MKDMMGDHDYLVYSEELEDGNIILVRTAYQSFENAISALRQFIRFLLVPIFVIAFIVIYFLSRSISHPLMELNRVAKKMKELDFKAKYKVISEDETGQLGNTLNELTIKLEDTIDKLKDELKKEKDMEKIRKEFVARVSHELQTPLSVIEGYIEAIEDKVYEKEEDVNRALGIISRESEKMSKMTQDLLDLSLMESGSYKLTTDRFNYIELIKDVYQRFLDRKKQACVTFILEIPNEDEFMVMGDVFRIEQVLNNLINNAFNYVSDCGKIVMRVTPDPDGWIKTEVSNTGSGISQEDLPFLWESFFKSHKEKGKKGAGLGLSIAKNIINLHNGKYDVKNIKDGVVFSFDLKYDKSEKGQ
ncbi:MAG: cell wall metabolism sensor histidine kinase WalK [Eubacteriaceae bacterium]|nr:cell wall metabolism sensor histidine kinase WalK [Eubacteriaceae bacterium]